MRPWQWCGKQHHGVGKVLAKGRATSETQQGEIDRSVHTSLYRPARLPLCPAHFGVVTNYTVSPMNWSPNNRRSSVFVNFYVRREHLFSSIILNFVYLLIWSSMFVLCDIASMKTLYVFTVLYKLRIWYQVQYDTNSIN